MRSFGGWALVALVGVGALALEARDASACGGCFVPTGAENVTVVTDHRMVLSVSPAQTTLYDQIQYSGDPAQFAWVLPIASEVKVGLSADVMFASLDALTRTIINPPPLNCPSPPYCGGDRGDYASAGASDAAAPPQNGGVDVTKHEVVGPYETVQLKATDPAALEQWLSKNGFVIPDDVKPTIAAYLADGFGFLALKLLPGKGVASMRPVRVTTMGAAPTLPLRMVAAGTGPKVGITLWVLAEGGYEPTNFQTFSIDNGDLVWDWSASRSNFAEVRAAKTAAAQNAAWEIESSTTLTQFRIENLITSGGRGFGPVSAAGDYLPVDGMTPMTADEVRQDDLQTLFAGIPNGAVRATRLRADLARAALVKDLQPGASADQSERSNVHNLTQDKNRPSCPTYPPCPGVYTGLGGGGGGCSTTSSRGGDDLGLAVAAGFLGLALARSRRKRG